MLEGYSHGPATLGYIDAVSFDVVDPAFGDRAHGIGLRFSLGRLLNPLTLST
jgi:hypothetical protein